MSLVESYYPGSPTVKLFLKLDFIMERESGRYNGYNTNLGPVPKQQSTSRKRSRQSCEDEYQEQLVRYIIRLMDKFQLFPTFRTMVDKKFYMQMATNMENELFHQISKFVAEFKHLLSAADRALYQEDYQSFYSTLTDDIFNILSNSQQILLLFSLSCNDSHNGQTNSYSA